MAVLLNNLIEQSIKSNLMNHLVVKMHWKVKRCGRLFLWPEQFYGSNAFI